ncbi:MAG TPA: CHAT domain-containing protein, partial [Planctomycetota bacterium]|nr:CHAT domain-containing protein [Planctomycetota bacterium]
RRDMDGARKLHEEALAALGDDSEASYVSSVCFEAGRFFQQRAEFGRAAALLERAADSAPRWDQQLTALGQLSQVELVRGRYGAALARLDEVNALASEHSPSPFDAQVLRARASLAFSLGELGLARELLEQLLELCDEDEDRAAVMADQALLAFMQDDWIPSIGLYDRALETAPESGKARWLALYGKAAVLLADERTKEAETLAREALALAGQLDDAHLRTASLITVSGIDARLGRGNQARKDAEAAVAELERQDSRELLLSAWHSLARAALLQGDETTVDELLDRAWAESTSAEVSALPSLEAAQLRSRLSELSAWGEVAADLLARRAGGGPDALAAGFRRIEQWKARTLLADIQGQPGVPDDLGRALAAALSGRTLVEYAAGEERLYAFVVDGESLRFVDLGPRRPTETLARRFIDGLRDEQRLAPPSDVARDGRRLFEALLEPLELPGERIVIVPDGELSRLPFEALVVAAPEAPKGFDGVVFALDRLDIGYAPSAAALVALAERGQTGPGDRVALLLGDPSYAAEAQPAPGSLLAARTTTGMHWARLPHSRDELTRVARILLTGRGDERAKEDLFRLTQLEDTRDVSLSTQAFELRLGKEATAAALSELAPRASLIHIAAHGQVDPWDTRRTGLVLAWEGGGPGLFSLADIAALELDADLVVLSACETARGRLLNDEGVQSMASAFHAAGARGVIATLWPVSDPQSQALMERFAAAYLAGGEAPDRAVRLAKRELRTAHASRGTGLPSAPPDPRRGHPHSWAPFLFSGAA